MAWAFYDDDNGRCDCPDSTAERRDMLGCIHHFRSPHWKTGKSVDDTRPFQHCQHCHLPCHATFCELRHDQDRQSGHLPEHCPKCIELRGWCDRRKVDEGAAHVYDLTLQSLFEDAEIAWAASEAGVEAKAVYKESEFLIQMRPWIFCIPSCTEPVYMPEALTVNEDRAALLSGDRLASGLSPAKLLVRVLSQDLASPPEVVVSGSGVSELLVPLDRKRRVFSLEGLVDYGARHGVTYFKPRGFNRWRRMVDPEKWASIKDWPVVYHGSSLANTTRILEDGLMVRPGLHRTRLFICLRQSVLQATQSIPHSLRSPTIVGAKRCCNAEYARAHTNHSLIRFATNILTASSELIRTSKPLTIWSSLLKTQQTLLSLGFCTESSGRTQMAPYSVILLLAWWKVRTSQASYPGPNTFGLSCLRTTSGRRVCFCRGAEARALPSS